MTADSAEVVLERFAAILEQSIKALLPNGNTSISMGVHHIYSKQGTILNFRPVRVINGGNRFALQISSGVPYFNAAYGFDEIGNKLTPRVNKSGGEQREIANYKIIETAIKTTCDALGLEFDNVSVEVSGL